MSAAPGLGKNIPKGGFKSLEEALAFFGINQAEEEKKANFALTKAKTQLLLQDPFFATVSMQLDIELSWICPTAMTDGKSIHWNPYFVNQLTPDELTAVIAHEVMHVVLLHHTRRGERDPWKWNVAGDHVINLILDECKYKLPSSATMDPKYQGWSTDAVYNDLPDMECPPAYRALFGRAGPTDPNGGFSGPPDPNGTGVVVDAKGADGKSRASPAEMAKAEEDAKILGQQAAQMAKQRGKLPAGIERIVDEIKKPKVDWREKLRRLMSAQFPTNYSWARPNRRFIHQGIYLPGIVKEGVGKVVVAIDTSGSIGDEQLAQFAGEVNDILTNVRPEQIIVIYCDADIDKVEEVDGLDDTYKVKGVGGGGTSFKPPFKYVEDHDLDPQVFVYLTDLYGDFPSSKPPYPVIWAVYGNAGKDKAPFGDTVHVEFDQE